MKLEDLENPEELKKKIEEFYSKPENIERIKRNKEFSEKVSEYVAEHSIVPYDVFIMPFNSFE